MTQLNDCVMIRWKFVGLERSQICWILVTVRLWGFWCDVLGDFTMQEADLCGTNVVVAVWIFAVFFLCEFTTFVLCHVKCIRVLEFYARFTGDG